MDLKAENLIMGADHQLKLIDFDFSMKLSEKESMGKGTPNYRAPEVKEGESPNPVACDIYSAGIVLFVLKFNIIPYLEDQTVNGHHLLELLQEDPAQFWSVHEELSKRKVRISDSFKELFEGMTKKDYSQRISIEEIRKNQWFNGPTYSEREIKNLMKLYFK